MPLEAKVIQFPTVTGAKTARKLHATGLIRLHFRYVDPITGIQREKDVYGKTEQAAEKKKQAFLRQVEQGLQVTQQGMTVTAWADNWLKVYKKPSVGAQTYLSYVNDISHITAAIGQKPLKAITQQDIVKLMTTRSGLSASAIKKTFMTVSALMDAALSNRLITYNPCKGVSLPSGTSGTHRPLTNDEIRLVLAVADDGHRFALPILLMLFAGLRRGEAAGFHADSLGADIHINKSIVWQGNQAIISTPKTYAGTRSIPILPPLDHYLINLTGYAAKSQRDPDQPITLTAFERGYQSFMTACEVKLNGCTKRWRPDTHVWKTVNIRCHDLRHTFATLLYDANVDIKTAQRWLGHSDPAITMRIYTHLSNSKHETATENAQTYFNQFLSGGSPGGSISTITQNSQ